MSFAWPSALSALLAVPFVLGVAWWSRRRRRRAAVRVTSAALVRAALPGRGRWQPRPSPRPCSCSVSPSSASARPARRPPSRSRPARPRSCSPLTCPGGVLHRRRADRLTAAEGAAAAFIKAQPGGSGIGLIAFAGVAGVIVPPTDGTEKLLAALRRRPPPALAIGQAILTSIDAIAEIDPSVSPTRVDVSAVGGEPAAYVPHTIVGHRRREHPGGRPAGTAEQAADRACASTRSASAQHALADGLRQLPGRRRVRRPGRLRRPRPRRPQPAGRRRGHPQAGRRHHGGSFYLAEISDRCSARWPTCLAPSPSPRSTSTSPAAFSAAGGLLVAVAIGLLWWNRVRRPPERDTSPPAHSARPDLRGYAQAVRATTVVSWSSSQCGPGPAGWSRGRRGPGCAGRPARTRAGRRRPARPARRRAAAAPARRSRRRSPPARRAARRAPHRRRRHRPPGTARRPPRWWATRRRVGAGPWKSLPPTGIAPGSQACHQASGPPQVRSRQLECQISAAGAAGHRPPPGAVAAERVVDRQQAAASHGLAQPVVGRPAEVDPADVAEARWRARCGGDLLPGQQHDAVRPRRPAGRRGG